MSGMFLMEKRAADYASLDYIQLHCEDLVRDASRLMSEQNKNEVIVLDD